MIFEASFHPGDTTMPVRTWLTIGSVLLACTAPAAAQPVADFYRGKTVNVLIGVGVGGEYDLQARLVARHIGKHIPGNPIVVPQNMTGAGGIKMANYLFAQAARDGTNIGMLGNNFPATQAVGGQGVQYDAVKFNWLGTIAPVVETMAVWSTTGVKSVADLRAREIIAGATGRGAITYIYPSMMNEFFGTRFKIVTGYQGGNEVSLAMERGEVQARNNTWSSWKATRPQWISEKKIVVVVQAGPRAHDLDAPSVEDLARNPQDRQIIELVVSGTRLGRPMATTPDVPADRLAALRAAYRATMADPEFRTDAANMNFDVAPVHGEDMQKIVAQIMSVPKDLAVRAKHLVE
jgi:tripartite-type tricarboxylate transporter receptor subunit TctC